MKGQASCRSRRAGPEEPSTDSAGLSAVPFTERVPPPSTSSLHDKGKRSTSCACRAGSPPTTSVPESVISRVFDAKADRPAARFSSEAVVGMYASKSARTAAFTAAPCAGTRAAPRAGRATGWAICKQTSPTRSSGPTCARGCSRTCARCCREGRGPCALARVHPHDGLAAEARGGAVRLRVEDARNDALGHAGGGRRAGAARAARAALSLVMQAGRGRRGYPLGERHRRQACRIGRGLLRPGAAAPATRLSLHLLPWPQARGRGG